MSKTHQRRLALVAALLLSFAPMLPAQNPQIKPGKAEYFQGKVVPLKDLVLKIGSKLDPDAAPVWMAMVTDDGKVFPLIKDDGSRMFFKDEKVRNRPMRITGRLFADTHLLQVLTVHSLHKGDVWDIYYWCDICAIRRPEGGICECCGGPMELREMPLKK